MFLMSLTQKHEAQKLSG